VKGRRAKVISSAALFENAVPTVADRLGRRFRCAGGSARTKFSSTLNQIILVKNSRTLVFVLLSAGILASGDGWAADRTDEDAIAVARSVIKADRRAAVSQVMQFSETESNAFWPTYDQYRAEMDKVADGLVKLVMEYAAVYPNVPEARARDMLTDLTALEQKKLVTRVDFLKKFGEVLPASKNLRFAQLENRLDLAIQLKLASEIPLMPIEGRLTGNSTASASVAPGVPGGAVVSVYELTAAVIAINKQARSLTLLGSDGIKQSIKVGPEAVNFDQIHVGDTVKIAATQQLVVQMAGPGESADDGSVAMVALAPKGAKPGGVLAETTQVAATVTDIDAQNRTATLRFEDGSTRTVPVRSDVDLGKRKAGEKVIISITEAIALTVQKP